VFRVSYSITEVVQFWHKLKSTMIDTIVLRIHGLEKYSALTSYILESRTGTAQGLGIIKDKTYLRFKYLHFKESDHSMLIYRDYIKRPSSNYDIAVAVIQFKDYIEISLSVPKYLYGTNVMMFTDSIFNNENFTYGDAMDLEMAFEKTFSRLGKFIRKLFRDIFPENMKIDTCDVEIKRLDFCWNQVFRDESDAKMYLMYQKMIKKKGARLSSEAMRSYETSIFYNSEYYTAKIYHKGTEYKRSDRLKHLAYNRLRKKEIFPVEDKDGLLGLQSCADRILRYEVSFKKPYLQYYYWRYYYRKSVPKIVQWKEWHAKVSASINNMSKMSGQKYKEAKEKHDEQFKGMPVIAFKQFEKLYAFAPYFMMSAPWSHEIEMKDDSDVFNGKKVVANRNQVFNKFLYNNMSKAFLTFVKNFEVKETVWFPEARKRVVDYNEKARNFKKAGLNDKEMYKGSIEKVLLLLQHYSMDELKRLDIIPKRTFYYWKKRLKDLGISENNVSQIGIPSAENNLPYLELVNNSRLVSLFGEHNAVNLAPLL
jgi:hypothetical protein